MFFFCFLNDNYSDFIDYLTTMIGSTGNYMKYLLDVIFPILVNYIAPTIFFPGLIGNILSLVVFGQKKLKESVASVYFRTLAVADMTALLSILTLNLDLLRKPS